MENKPTVFQTGLRYGLILGLALIVLTLIFNIAGVALDSKLRWLGILAPIILIYLGHEYFKGGNDGYMSYGQGLGIGTVLGGASYFLSGVFGWIYNKFVDDSLLNGLMENQRLALEEQGLGDAQIDQAMDITEMFASGPLSILMAVIVGLIVGLIISLIVSAITKNSNPDLEI